MCVNLGRKELNYVLADKIINYLKHKQELFNTACISILVMEKIKLNIYKIIIINSILIVVLFLFINALAYGLLLYKHTVMDKIPFKYFNYRTNSGTLRVNQGIPELLNMQPEEILQLNHEMITNAYMIEPYTFISPKPREGKYVNIHKESYRIIAREMTNENPNSIKTYVFGGSTTFGYGITDKDTIPAYIQDYLSERFPKKDFVTYNYCRSAYFLKHEFVLLWSLLMKGHRPDIVIFIDGLNELTSEASMYTEELNKMYMIYNDKSKYYFGEIFYLIADTFPIYHLGKILKRKYLREKSENIAKEGNVWVEKINQLKNRYLLNMEVIRLLGEKFNFSPYFFLQPVPGYKNMFDKHMFLTKEQHSKYLKKNNLLMSHLEKEANKSYFISLTDMLVDFVGQPFVDSSHYTPEVCKLIAKRIVEKINVKHFFK